MAEPRDLPLELQVVLALAGLGAAILFASGVALLSTGGTTVLLLGGATAAVAFGQVVALVALYRGRVWAWSTVLAFLVAGAILQAGTGDLFGAGVSALIAGYLYVQRGEFAA